MSTIQNFASEHDRRRPFKQSALLHSISGAVCGVLLSIVPVVTHGGWGDVPASFAGTVFALIGFCIAFLSHNESDEKLSFLASLTLSAVAAASFFTVFMAFTLAIQWISALLVLYR